MSGEGKRFVERGYTFPKPLVEIIGRPMIEVVVENITPAEPHEFIFVCKQEHVEQFALADVLRLVAPTCQIVTMRQPTAGALCSVLLAMEHINTDDEVLVANADQVIDVSIDTFLSAARNGAVDGCVMTFPSTHPKWSYAKVEDGEVVAIAEKRPISHHATVGLYYFRSGKDFIEGAERMILKSATLKGEFYVSPVYNELILAGRRITIHEVAREQMHSLGTPEDVETFAAAKAREHN
jgi:NDP-sugar pyrophosphorylase family protein